MIIVEGNCKAEYTQALPTPAAETNFNIHSKM